MKRKELLITSLSFGALIFVLNEMALFLGLFWTIWWLDLAFHFVGGFAVGSLVLGLFVSRGTGFWAAVRIVLLATLSIALLWESYEFIFREAYTNEYAVDSVTDVVLGLAGGLSALFFIPRTLWNLKGNVA